MGSLIDELQRREAAAGAEAEELRRRIAELAEQLARAEERLSRVVIARETVEEVLDSAATEIAPVSPAVVQPALPGPGRSPVAGVVTVPPWRAGLEVSVLPRDYRDLLEVAEDAGRPLRAGQIAAAAGLCTDRGKVETLRSKLKRLAERGWLAEEAGLVALPARNGSAGEAVKPG
jgi:chromosome segregation ATPase